MIEVDPRIEQAFADVLTRSRNRNADITDRLAAQQRRLEAQSEKIKQDGQKLTQDLDRRVAERRETAQNNPWQARESKPTVLAFGGEDEEGRKPRPVQPPAVSYPPVPPPPPGPEPQPQPAPAPNRFLAFEVDEEEAAPRRPMPQPQPRPATPAAGDDEDDDYSGRSWVR